MTDPGNHALSTHEKNTADQTFELFSQLDTEQVERVFAHVQGRLAASRSADRSEGRIMFSRGIASPFGKLTCVAKTKVDEPTFERFLQHCATHNTDVATVLRDWIYYSIYEKTCQQMIAERITGSAVEFTQALAKKASE